MIDRWELSTKKEVMLTKIKRIFCSNSKKQHFDNLLGAYDTSNLKKSKSIIIIANSGEIVGLNNFLKKLKTHYSDHNLIALIQLEEALDVCKTMPELDAYYFLCLDNTKLAKKTFKKLKAELVIFLEKAFCPNTLFALKKSKIKHGIINAICTDEDLKKRFTRRLSHALNSRSVFESLDFLGVQNEQYCENFKKLSLNNKNTEILGQLKASSFNKISKEEEKDYKNILMIDKGEKILVAGGTYLEEDYILDALQKVRQRFPNTRLILCPRMFDTIPELIKKIKERNMSVIKKSELSKNKTKTDIIIGDTFGDLIKLYGISDINILGRSFLPYKVTKKGGSNIFEAAIYGKPILFGENMESHKEYTKEVTETFPELQVSGEKLGERIIQLLQNKEQYKKIGRFLIQFSKKHAETQEKYLELIKKNHTIS
ncbi:hypothetical protein HZA97_04250 [Candidatus Woesearchaeota archaeon]|nr:hypothetical protein [Candidatus Woesearchaeota archaeon]